MGLQRQPWMAFSDIFGKTTQIGKDVWAGRGTMERYRSRGNDRGHIVHLGNKFKAVRFASFQHKRKYSGI